MSVFAVVRCKYMEAKLKSLLADWRKAVLLRQPMVNRIRILREMVALSRNTEKWDNDLYEHEKARCIELDKVLCKLNQNEDLSIVEGIRDELASFEKARHYLFFDNKKQRYTLNPVVYSWDAGTQMDLEIYGVCFPFRWCPPGWFMMGSPPSEHARKQDETLHSVTLAKGFWMLEIPVTQEMWKAVMATRQTDSQIPVTDVSWDACREYASVLNMLNIVEELLFPGFWFALPTEAQWEYACRAGTKTPFHFGSDLNGEKACCAGKVPYGTEEKGRNACCPSTVRSFSCNDWNLYDMHGNVSEWCQDYYDEYPNEATVDPEGPSSGENRVHRGGSWGSYPQNCRAASRGRLQPTSSQIGMRLVIIEKTIDPRKHIYPAALKFLSDRMKYF